MKNLTCLCFVLLLKLSLVSNAQSYPAPKSFGDVQSFGKNIQRTMRLLATSTPEKRNTVKILFYGQSITEQKWTERVVNHLKNRFPHANLITENRAIGGHSSQRLHKTAEADLYPFYPDLVIFHVYGSHVDYEKIIKGIREKTTAEILMQNDHINKVEQLSEVTDPAKALPHVDWGAFMNHNFLPKTAKKYGAEFCDQRSVWKQYLKDYSLKPSDLLKDGIHLNAHGEYLMGEIVNSYLRYDPKFKENNWQNISDLKPVIRGNQIELTVDGNRIDIISKSKGNTVQVIIDDKKPSEISSLYKFSRTGYFPRMNWPCLLRVQSQKPLLEETWTATLNNVSKDGKSFNFKIEGSKTGFDGEGHSSKKFVSKSGRVVIDPKDWNIEYGMKVNPSGGKKVLAGNYKFSWKVLPMFKNSFAPEGPKGPSIEQSLTIAQGLHNGKHKLILQGSGVNSIKAIRVYKPTPVK